MTKKAKQPKQKGDSFWKKFQILRLVAFSCHEKALTILGEWAQDVAPGLRFHIYEYFLKSPTHMASKSNSGSAFVPFVDTEVTSKGYCLAIPQGGNKEDKKFLDKIVADLELVLKGKKESFSFPLAFSSQLPTWDVITRLCLMGPLVQGELSKKLYKSWQKGMWRNQNVLDRDSWCRLAKRADCLVEMKKKLIISKPLGTSVRLAWANIFSLIYTPLLTTPKTTDEILFVAVPIASPLVFYGVLVVVAEITQGCSLTEQQIYALLDEMVELSERYYLPTLILAQNSWEEQRSSDILRSKGKEGDCAKVLAQYLPVAESVYSNPSLYAFYNNLAKKGALTGGTTYARPVTVNSVAQLNCRLESAILDLWHNRMPVEPSEALETLVFRKMMIASPGMLDTVHSILHAGRSIQPRTEKKDPLPSILVVGSHGSGKEDVSRLIPLFTNEYWNIKPQTINVASISEPNELRKEIEQKVGHSNTAVLFVDELNSLNMQVQGALLRLLEQGELKEQDGNAKGGKKKSNELRNWLIVGMINEDPRQLTLGEIRERTSDPFLFGQLFGTLLYEHLKTRSRMRDDLYYRVRRCGEIHVYDLDERKEDIPVILYYLLTTRSMKGQDVFISYEAMLQLVRPELRWKGNVRQLELVARELGSIISEHPRTPVYVISALEMKEALRRAQME